MRGLVGAVSVALMLGVGNASTSLSFSTSQHLCPPVKRSQAVLKRFQRLYPCPSTGKTTGPCPGWTKDHVIPICLGPEAGGVDSISNLQWSTLADAKVKDRWEKAQCRLQPRPC